MLQRDLTLISLFILNAILYGGVYLMLTSPGGAGFVYPSVFLIMILTNLIAYFASKRWPEQRILWSLGFGIVPVFLGLYNLLSDSSLAAWLAPVGFGIYIILTCSLAGYYGVIAKLKKEQP
jgi:peptidoglycan/LPS O-acetylase OafA/YrhL